MIQSELERATLMLFHELHGHLGFPSPEMITVTNRKNTGAGRYVSLNSSAQIQGFSGYLDMGGHFIEMEGVESGMMATISIIDEALDELEFSVYGDSFWDGEERLWKIL
jgi:hypothetical protein